MKVTIKIKFVAKSEDTGEVVCAETADIEIKNVVAEEADLFAAIGPTFQASRKAAKLLQGLKGKDDE